MPVFRLTDQLAFPSPHLATEEGLLAVGGDLSIDRLLLAYSQGIFPWYSEGQPILWWSPDPRMVLYPDEFKRSKSLDKTIRRELYQVTFDTAFGQVINACADTRIRNSEGTWITPEMRTAYTQLHEQGYAHSVEAWYHGQIVGGLYGICLGRIFFGESMFSTMTDASKVCLVELVKFARNQEFTIIDCQVPTPHLRSLGARNIARRKFLTLLNQSLQFPSLTSFWNAG